MRILPWFLLVLSAAEALAGIPTQPLSFAMAGRARPIACEMRFSKPEIIDGVIVIKDGLFWRPAPTRAVEVRDLPYPLQFVGPRMLIGRTAPDAELVGSLWDDFVRAHGPQTPTLIVDLKRRTATSLGGFHDESRWVQVTTMIPEGFAQRRSFIFQEHGAGSVVGHLAYDGQNLPSTSYQIFSDHEPRTLRVVKDRPDEDGVVNVAAFFRGDLLLALSQIAAAISYDVGFAPRTVHYQTQWEDREFFARRVYPLKPDVLSFYGFYGMQNHPSAGPHLAGEVASFANLFRGAAVRAWLGKGRREPNTYQKVYVVEVNLGERTTSFAFAQAGHEVNYGNPPETQSNDINYDRVIAMPPGPY